MAVKLKRKVEVAAIDTIDEKYRELYEERAGALILTGIDDHDAPDILRTVRGEAAGLRIKNTQLTAQLEVFSGLEPEAVRQALVENVALKAETAAHTTKDKKLFDDAVASRVKVELAQVQSKLDSTVKERDTLLTENAGFKKGVTTRKIHDEMLAACVKQGVQKTAYTGKYPDALTWAEQVAVITEDGKIVEKETGLPLADALRAMQDAGERSHWFGTSSGGSATGGTGGVGKANPWTADNWNAMEQSLIQEKDPARAEAMAKVAGVPVDAPFHPKNGMPSFSQY